MKLWSGMRAHTGAGMSQIWDCGRRPQGGGEPLKATFGS
jgi:hypothetical protein